MNSAKGDNRMIAQKKRTWIKQWDLFWSFLLISPITFGGGYAMLPSIERIVVDRKGWLTETEMEEAIAISGAAPGGIGVNAAAYIGYKVMGWRGMLSALAGIMLPTFIIVLGLAIFFMNMRDHLKVQAALQGIQIGVIALVAYAGVKMVGTAFIDKTTILLFIISLCGLLYSGLHPVFILLFGALAGVLWMRVKEKMGYPAFFEKPQTMNDYYFGDGI
jgi:chromate transporter